MRARTRNTVARDSDGEYAARSRGYNVSPFSQFRTDTHPHQYTLKVDACLCFVVTCFCTVM